MSDSDESLYWKSTFRLGLGNLNTGLLAGYIDSYSAAERLVEGISASASSAMKTISYTGFSAGGQITLRLALLTNMDAIAAAKGIKMQYVVGDPGSYTYFDDKRPAKKCRALGDTGVDHTCTEFEVPDLNEAAKDFPPLVNGELVYAKKGDSSNCSLYNDWNYGLTESSLKVAASRGGALLGEFVSGKRSLSDAKAAYGKKSLYLILGTQDVCNCRQPNMVNNPKVCYPLAQFDVYYSYKGCFKYQKGQKSYSAVPKFVKQWTYDWTTNGLTQADVACCDSGIANVVDLRCQGMLQGSNRLQRGQNWFARAKQYYGKDFAWQSAYFTGGHDDAPFVLNKKFKEVVLGI